jgi:F420-non-reducing hydrogenase iron-sulfur subunit
MVPEGTVNQSESKTSIPGTTLQTATIEPQVTSEPTQHTDQVDTSCPAPMQKEIEAELKSETRTMAATESGKDFTPRIIAFCCNWCSYAGADLAGVSRLQYPPNVRIIRVLCSGRIEPDFVLRALELGADGVLVAGCHPGDCHYISGNLKAEKRFQMVTKLLEVLGLEKERARLEWISASEGPKFAATITEFVDQVKELGPSIFRK